MKIIAFDKHCPVCRTSLETRIRRKYWMRLIPGTKHYNCDYFGGAVPIWLFSLLYSVMVYFVIRKNIGVLDIIGRYITPVLLASIGVVCVKAFIDLPELQSGSAFDGEHFLMGITEGYNTMDLIAAFFFSASVIHIINKSGNTMGKTLSLVFKSSLIGMGILGAVYICLIAMAGHYSAILVDVPNDQMLAFLSQAILGPAWSIVAIVAICSACFSTSIALILVYMEFLEDDVLKNEKYHNLSIFIALGSSYVMSLFGLQGITYITAPILKICYPLLLILIVFNIIKMAIRAKKSELSSAES